MKKKVVLVTGASGYLGGRLCRELFNAGHHVKAFVRRTSDLSSLPPPTDGGSSGGTLELVFGDVTDYQSLLQACSGCQIIFHAAALVEPWLPDPSRFISVSTIILSLKGKHCDSIRSLLFVIFTPINLYSELN